MEGNSLAKVLNSLTLAHAMIIWEPELGNKHHIITKSVERNVRMCISRTKTGLRPFLYSRNRFLHYDHKGKTDT